LLNKEHAEGISPEALFNNQKQQLKMKKEIMQLLGLAETASEQEVANAVRLLKEKADKADGLQLASINAIVDAAVADKRITADKKDHFVSLGKSAGIEALRTTLELMHSQQKPTDVIRQTNSEPSDGHKTFAKLSEVPAEEIASLKENNPTEYARLYKAEYGVEV
jgi:hypothetical protein